MGRPACATGSAQTNGFHHGSCLNCVDALSQAGKIAGGGAYSTGIDLSHHRFAPGAMTLAFSLSDATSFDLMLYQITNAWAPIHSEIL